MAVFSRLARSPIGLAAPLACVLSLLAAEASRAATVSSTGAVITFTAEPGEANELTLGFTQEAVSFVDAGAPITAGPGCEPAEAGVSCPELQPFTEPGIALTLDLGNRNDRLELDDCIGDRRPISVWGSRGDDAIVIGACAGAELTVYGGPHDDAISTRMNYSGTSSLYGGEGRDRLTVNEGGRTFLFGGPDHDDFNYYVPIFDESAPTEFVQVHGEGGNDVFRPGDPALIERTIFGGTGWDTLVLPPDRGTFDLADCVACEIEAVIGSEGDDVIYGDDRPNFIASGGGDDTIDPRGGRDTVYTGDGNDTVTATDRVRDVIRCGAGLLDTVFADRREWLGQCEIVRRREA